MITFHKERKDTEKRFVRTSSAENVKPPEERLSQEADAPFSVTTSTPPYLQQSPPMFEISV
jgi:hypothetical protein